MDLSSLKGHSLKYAISPQVAHMHYASVLDAAELIRRLCPGTLMAKVDMQHAYRVLRMNSFRVLTSGSAKDALLMHLLRCLQFYLTHFDIRIAARHLAGVENTAADALSRDNLTVFFQCQPQANPSPSPLQPALKELLLLQSPDWLSPTWRVLFLATLHSP